MYGFTLILEKNICFYPQSILLNAIVCGTVATWVYLWVNIEGICVYYWALSGVLSV